MSTKNIYRRCLFMWVELVLSYFVALIELRKWCTEEVHGFPWLPCEIFFARNSQLIFFVFLLQCLAFKALGKLILDVGLLLACHCDRYGKFILGSSFCWYFLWVIRIYSTSSIILFTTMSEFLDAFYIQNLAGCM